jgi:CDP-diacylglycerol--glycerol-3-phosphate 3-phosphatidyltransferase
LHGDAAPTGLTGAWLRVIYTLAGPPARLRVAPDVVTVAGLVVAGLVLLPAAAGGRWPLLAAALIVVSGVLDGVDGAIAVLTDRVTALGAVLDTVCDRLADVCFITALWLAGAPAGWCVAGAVVALLHEQLRATARAGGMREIGVVTVSERPTRLIVSAAFLLAVGIYPSAASTWAGAGAVAWTLLGVAGFAQLAIVVTRRLR